MKIKLNDNFSFLSERYLFSEINARVEKYNNSQIAKREIISLGIGDVSRPIPQMVAEEMAKATIKMSTQKGFRGYGDTLGERPLREAISNRYLSRGVSISADEIFINDGAKSDLGNINDILGDNDVILFNPVYPVYLDASIISGRRVHQILADESNDFLPSPQSIPKKLLDKSLVIYLCSPNNPTGATFTQKGLEEWVNFALYGGSLIVFDAAYESYISDWSLPRSIFEIDGAEECAVEVCSFSKSAGFTGIRCGWTAISKKNPLQKLWKRRQSSKFNGASYISQMGALASLSPKGSKECEKNIAYYMENAYILARFLNEKGISVVGGINAPYLWLKCPHEESSWRFFDMLLEKAQVVGTPGVGFGSGGEGYFRLTSFNSRENTLEAIERLNEIL